MKASAHPARFFPVLMVAFMVTISISAIVVFVRLAPRLWHERARARAATELAERYLALMNSGRCAAAQRLTVFPGPPEFCARHGETLSDLHVRCEHIEHRHERHHVNCDVEGTSNVRIGSSVQTLPINTPVMVLIVPRDGRLQVVDATSRADEALVP